MRAMAGVKRTQPPAVVITYGYSWDHRPDLKLLVVDLMCSGDGDIPLYLRVADGNELDKAVFAQFITAVITIGSDVDLWNDIDLL